MACIIGNMHDIGKWQSDFQKRIRGEKIKIEHSICGAIEAEKNTRTYGIAARLMEYVIAGHHSGIPDGGIDPKNGEKGTLCERMGHETEDYSQYKKELEIPVFTKEDSEAFAQYLKRDCITQDQCIDKISFLVRYLASCLIDADWLDTASFYGRKQRKELKADFQKCLERVNECLAEKTGKSQTRLQKARNEIQFQVFEKKNRDAKIYLLNMPTGSGKTLASIKFALERAISHGKKRIIYIIPYNSIIDQTAAEFEELFARCAKILRHQSTFSYEDREDMDEDEKEDAKLAAENWDADIIITTAVQFFESLHSNKRSKLRKLHNMADSMLVFDEVHLMPIKFFQPCLESIVYLTQYCNSEALFLTATMPDFEKVIANYMGKGVQIENLVTDKSQFDLFKKCSFHYYGEWTAERLLEEAKKYPTSLIIGNTKKTVRKLYQMASWKGEIFHLSTYMMAEERKQTIAEISKKMEELERDYPGLENVPEERQILVISTSLIEAGVNLDFSTAFRELTGLDSILQVAGRCNREGKRQDAKVFIFTLEGTKICSTDGGKSNQTKWLIEKYEDIASPECILEYYDKVFLNNEKEMRRFTMYNYMEGCGSKKKLLIPFKSYAEDFHLIEDGTVSIVIQAYKDENEIKEIKEAKELVERLRFGALGNDRKLQRYTCSVSRQEFEDLQKQHVIEDYESGIYCLTNPDYYEKGLGIMFEASDYII